MSQQWIYLDRSRRAAIDGSIPNPRTQNPPVINTDPTELDFRTAHHIDGMIRPFVTNALNVSLDERGHVGTSTNADRAYMRPLKFTYLEKMRVGQHGVGITSNVTRLFCICNEIILEMD